MGRFLKKNEPKTCLLSIRLFFRKSFVLSGSGLPTQVLNFLEELLYLSNYRSYSNNFIKIQVFVRQRNWWTNVIYCRICINLLEGDTQTEFCLIRNLKCRHYRILAISMALNFSAFIPLLEFSCGLLLFTIISYWGENKRLCNSPRRTISLLPWFIFSV